MSTRSRCRTKLRRFQLPIVIAACTILQSLAHAWWSVYGREFIACEVKVKRKLEFYLYLTYFYGNACDNYALNEYAASFSFNLTPISYQPSLRNSSHFFKLNGTMAKPLLDFYLVVDAFWIVTSVSLLIGVIMRLKQCSALIFYVPWIIVAIISLTVDLCSTIYFAMQLPDAQVLQPPGLWKLDAHVIMAICSGRLGVIWLLNLFSMVYIWWYARIAFRQRYADENGGRKRQRRQDNESRIKNWQVFYGAAGDEDLDYTSTFKDLEEYNRRKEAQPESNDLCSTFKSSSSINEASTSSANRSQKRVQILDLVSHLPWSYIEPRRDRRGCYTPTWASGGNINAITENNSQTSHF